MASLSLQEAAEQVGTSKADVWRAIRAGSLSAERTDDGGFAIDSAELFRVFETRPPEQRPTEEKAMASPEALPETSAAPEAAGANDTAAAFAALQAELRGLLGPLAEALTNNEPRQVEEELSGGAEPSFAPPKPQPFREETAAEMKRADAVIVGTETEPPIAKPANEQGAEPAPKRPWWKRLAG